MGGRERKGARASTGATATTAYFTWLSVVVVALALFVTAFGGSLDTFAVVRVVIAVLTLTLLAIARVRRTRRERRYNTTPTVLDDDADAAGRPEEGLDNRRKEREQMLELLEHEPQHNDG